MTRLVVVGGGIAAVRLAQDMRKRDRIDEIVIVSAERHEPYDRPPLSKAVLRGERGLPVLLESEAWDELQVDLRLGVTATGLQPGRRRLLTDAGALSYDTLVIATGARARMIVGLPGGVLRSMDDAVALRGALASGSTLAIIGAGLIGCEVAAGARALGVEVHLIDLLGAPMERVLGRAAGVLATGLHESHGVTLHLGVTTKSAGDALVLSDGTVLRPDAVLHAVGATPDTEWLGGSGVMCADGVVCDEAGRTSVPDVYAIGDVARWGRHRAEHWTSATEQAIRLAATLVGESPAEPEVAYWWSDQYDLKFQGLGTAEASDRVVVGSCGPARRPLAIFGRDGRVCGAVAVSAARPLMRLRSAINDRLPLDETVAAIDGFEPSLEMAV